MYHALTIGTLADELVRRIDGRSVAEVLTTEVTGPRGIDVWLAAPDSVDDRVVESALPTMEELAIGPLPEAVVGDPLSAVSLPAGDPFALFARVNEPSFRRVGPPAAGAVASGRGLAALYASVRHEVAGRPRLLGDDAIGQMAQVQVTGSELGGGLEIRFGVIFQAPCPRWPFGGIGAFGHDGVGGSLAFHDPTVDVSFGYVVQRLPLPGGMDARAVELARLVRKALGAAA